MARYEEWAVVQWRILLEHPRCPQKLIPIPEKIAQASIWTNTLQLFNIPQ